MSVLEELGTAVRIGEEARAAELVQQALDSGIEARQVLEQGLVAGMDAVGRQFREGELFLPDVLLAARAMNAGLAVLRPLLEGSGGERLCRVVIGTVQGDLHDIGKNLVGIMLRGAGFEVIDLGNDVAPERFVQAVQESGARIVGMSALLTTTMPVMERVIAGLERAGLKGRVKTIIGGAPVSAEFASAIGADGYGYDAAAAVEICREWTKGYLPTGQ